MGAGILALVFIVAAERGLRRNIPDSKPQRAAVPDFRPSPIAETIQTTEVAQNRGRLCQLDIGSGIEVVRQAAQGKIARQFLPPACDNTQGAVAVSSVV